MTLTLVLLFSVISIQAQNTLNGVYHTGKENTKIEINESEGKVLTSDKAKEGMLILRDIELVDGHWKAKLFSAKKKKWYDAVLKESEGILKVTVDAGIVSKTIEWTKE